MVCMASPFTSCAVSGVPFACLEDMRLSILLLMAAELDVKVRGIMYLWKIVWDFLGFESVPL